MAEEWISRREARALIASRGIEDRDDKLLDSAIHRRRIGWRYRGPAMGGIRPGGPGPLRLRNIGRDNEEVHLGELESWCAQIKGSISEEPVVVSGGPGRPTSMNLVLAEFDRRRERGETPASRFQEAKELAAW